MIILIGLLHILIWSQVIDAKLLGNQFYENTLSSRLGLQDIGSRNLLIPLNVTRNPGSVESQEIQKFISNHFKQLNNPWIFEPDCFIERDLEFCNLVFTLGRNASNYLVLAAHYDSKILPEGFIGAIDSAASCSVLLYVSEFLDTFFGSLTESMESTGLASVFDEFDGIKVVFFDGEEALDQWTTNDSIYGAKHLAARWKKSGILDSIGLLILLDLLGSREDVKVPSYFSQSDLVYNSLLATETLHQNELPHKKTLFDRDDLRFLKSNRIVIEDDHLPFLACNISVLHLIPLPFPSYWHTLGDTFDEVDERKVQNWAILLCEYVASHVIPTTE
ncbi:LAME_0E10550g1_1 [Lachancea meyersii CBS 8951]|uniref:Peptide hydrolase n=1 Tax=Lachancea meyersii CBS 8951 TaxID=1266667 RepID=A0A1G4JKE2_9SACH|nr:LAME_0E10550g1_1 [Lachancea meyersii CBS 8951]